MSSMLPVGSPLQNLLFLGKLVPAVFYFPCFSLSLIFKLLLVRGEKHFPYWSGVSRFSHFLPRLGRFFFCETGPLGSSWFAVFVRVCFDRGRLFLLPVTTPPADF